ncbi:MAG TPA: hypothetical protein VF808_06215 [Ktedonobacterales bacterium]
MGDHGEMARRDADWGPLGWWLRLTAPQTPPASAWFEARERARRGRLVSVLLLAFLAIEVAALWLYVVVDDDHPLMKVALLVALAVAGAAVALNRIGEVAWSGALLVALACLPAVGIPATAIGGQLDVLHLGSFYLLAGSVLVAGSVLPPLSVFPVAAINSGAVVALLALMPRTAALSAVLASNNGPQAYAGPIALQVVVALIAYLWATSTLDALRRADRAEEIAALERREVERAHEVEEGVQELLTVHVRLANGDFSARVPPVRNAPLWRIGVSLNTLVARFARLAEAERALAQSQVETRRLAAALVARRMGLPAPWPNPTGAPLDEVIAALSGAAPSAPPASPIPPERSAPSSAEHGDSLYPRLPYWDRPSQS